MATRLQNKQCVQKYSSSLLFIVLLTLYQSKTTNFHKQGWTLTVGPHVTPPFSLYKPRSFTSLLQRQYLILIGRTWSFLEWRVTQGLVGRTLHKRTLIWGRFLRGDGYFALLGRSLRCRCLYATVITASHAREGLEVCAFQFLGQMASCGFYSHILSVFSSQ